MAKDVKNETLVSQLYSSLFTLGRIEGFPSQYPEVRNAANVDVLEAGLYFVSACLGASFMIVLFPKYGGKATVFLVIRTVIAVLVGTILLTSIYGQYWEVGMQTATVPYKAGAPEEIEAHIGLNIGLRGVNITLKSDGDMKHELKNEEINYNERFSWTWDQGRIGFGPFAGRIQQEFRAAQRRGLPIPILWVAEYFTIDGEGFRFGRFYRTAGWYTQFSLWVAMPAWLLSNLLFLTVVRYGALWAIITGVLQLSACFIWSVIRNPIPLEVPFNGGMLVTTCGSDFWKTMFSGIVCVTFGVVVILCDLRFPDETAVFFGRDPLSEYEECHLDPEEVDLMRTEAAKQWEELVRQRKIEEMRQMQPSGEGDFDMIELTGEDKSFSPGSHPQIKVSGSPTVPIQPSPFLLKRGTTVRRAQRGLFRTPAPVAPTNVNFYLNVRKEHK